MTATTATTIQDLGVCDYLVIGSGAASMAFVDTLLTELPDSRIVMLDRHVAPGGHWNDAYSYVHLHQPSLLYGVASKQLEGNWAKLILTKRTLPWVHRASRNEILAYYQSLVEEWGASGQLRYFSSCSYDFNSINEEQVDSQEQGGQVHQFHSLDGSVQYKVRVNVKLVNGILGENRVPSQCPPQFPVHDGVQLITPNQLANMAPLKKKKNHPEKKYVVLGGGKTGMDAVVFLQRQLKVNPANISWVIPNDVWMLNRSSSEASPFAFVEGLLHKGGDFEKACVELEERNIFVRLDKNVTPTRFRFPVIGQDELKLLRKVIPNVIRRGRVTGLEISSNGDDLVEMKFGKGSEPVVLSRKDTTFVHCTSPGPFNDNKVENIFSSDSQMNLFVLFAPPVPISMSCLAKLEAARVKGALDVNFGKRVLMESSEMFNDPSAGDVTANDILQRLIRPLNVTGSDGNISKVGLTSLMTMAAFLALVDENPEAGRKWMQQNRLSFFSVPGFKGQVYEHTCSVVEQYKTLGFTDEDAKVMRLLADKLQPLEGK